MNVFGITHRGYSLFVVPTLAVILGSWIALSTFAPFTTAVPQLGLDASWVAVMGEAADRGLRWGPDIAFTYGPASPLVTAYFNDAYLTVTLPLLVGTCLLTGLCAVLLAGRSIATLATVSVCVGLVAACAGAYPDGVFLVLPVFPFLLVLSRDRPSPARSSVAAATAAAVGMVGLAKMSYPLSALPLFLLGDAAALLRRRVPVLAAPCVVGILLADLLYRQSLGDLPVFLARQGEVIAGYGDAMALDGSRLEFWGYLVACAVLIVVTLATERSSVPRHAGSRAVVPLGLTWTLLVLLKAGFIRQDTHTAIAWFGLALAAVPVAIAGLRPVRPLAALAALAVMAAALAVAAPLGLLQAGTRSGPPARDLATAALDTFVTRPAAQLAAAWNLASDPAGFAAARRGAAALGWRDIAAQAPLPRLDGSVDVVPSLQSRVIAAGLDYRPRPSFQEYSSYTPGLLAANATFLAGPHAPRWVLFGPETALGQMAVDGRYPNFAEGALWPDLVRLYRPERRIGDLVALERRADPAPVALGPPRKLVVGFDDPVVIEAGSENAAFATVDLRPTPLGRALSFLYRMPILTLSVDFADGHQRAYRFIPGIAAAGFVLSPTVDNASEFVEMAGGVRPPAVRTVTRFSLHAATRFASLLWHPAAVEIRPMSVVAAPPAQPASAWDALAAGEALAPGAVDVGAVPPSLLSVPVSGLSRVELGYGLALDEGEPAGAAALCFMVHPADGTGQVLWRNCLDRRSEADRAPHALSLALPPGTSEVALDIMCRSGCEEGVQGYWARP